MSRTLTALFDNSAQAERAVSALISAGIDRSRITVTDQSSVAGGTASGSQEEHGFWHALKELFLPDEDRHTYSEGLRRGGTLVSVRAEDGTEQRVIDILDREGSVDLDARQAEWRSSGWSGYQAGRTSTDRVRTGDQEAAIPIVEEQLAVGKREVERGNVRVRSYVVETPVQEQVTLRDEHVRIERRPVDQPIGADTTAAFKDKIIEVTETGEEAVVGKTAYVREEVVVRKDVDQHTETVQDTVRRTEVDVEDTRTSTATPTTRSGSPTGR